MKQESSNASVLIDTANGSIERQCIEPSPLPPLLEDLVAAGRSGLIIFSSGSTGTPKLMLHDLDNLVDSYRISRKRPITMMLFLLFDHIGGINTLLNVLAMGGAAVIPKMRTPDEAGMLIEQHSVSILPTSPTFLNLMMMNGVFDKYNNSSLRMITYGTEPMPQGLLNKIHAVLPHTRLLQTFGTSETGIVSTISRSPESLLVKFNDPSVEYRVVDGELWLRSERRILGYLNHSNESFDEEGWFRTGDVVEEEEGGYLRIKGRMKEVINVGGEKVLPAEVESVLMAMPAVLDCKVFGEKNHVTGQFVAADIVIDRANEYPCSIQDIRRFALSRMDAYKVPVRIKFVDSIPYSPRYKKQLRLIPSDENSPTSSS